jgi:hypothetical protein
VLYLAIKEYKTRTEVYNKQVVAANKELTGL